MIDEKKLLEEIDYYIMQTYITQITEHRGANYCYTKIKELVCRQPKVGEWIPVSVRLPEKGKRTDCLVTIGHRNRINENANAVFVEQSEYDARLDDIIPHFECEDERQYVLAWMPLPEPFKGE